MVMQSRGSAKVVVPASAVLLALSAMSSGAPSWYSSFETQADTAVTHNLALSTSTSAGPWDIDNSIAGGLDGWAVNGQDTAAVDPTDYMRYVAYGEAGVPAIPSALDPGGVSGGFAWWNPATSATSVKRGIYTREYAGNDDFTTEGYFNFGLAEAPTGSVLRRLFTQRRGTGSTSTRISVGLSRNDANTANVLTFYYYNVPANAGAWFKGTTPITQGDWHHFALVVDRQDMASWDVAVYLDGQLEASSLGANIGANASTNNSSVLGNLRPDSGSGDAFVGLMDSFRISNEALLPSQLLVPEPASILLLVGGAASMLRRRVR